MTSLYTLVLVLASMWISFCQSSEILELFPEFEDLKTSSEQLKTSYQQLKTSIEQLTTSTELFRANAQVSIDSLRADVNNVQDRTAFSAHFSETAASNSKNMADGEIYIFDKVETNIGNRYSTSTGKFTAPKTGLYAFTWTLCADSRERSACETMNQEDFYFQTNEFPPLPEDCDGGYGEFGSELVVGGVVLGKLHVDTERKYDDACSTGFVIANVPGGNTVYLQNFFIKQGAILSKESQSRTTFSGWTI